MSGWNGQGFNSNMNFHEDPNWENPNSYNQMPAPNFPQRFQNRPNFNRGRYFNNRGMQPRNRYNQPHAQHQFNPRGNFNYNRGNMHNNQFNRNNFQHKPLAGKKRKYRPPKPQEEEPPSKKNIRKGWLYCYRCKVYFNKNAVSCTWCRDSFLCDHCGVRHSVKIAYDRFNNENPEPLDQQVDSGDDSDMDDEHWKSPAVLTFKKYETEFKNWKAKKENFEKQSGELTDAQKSELGEEPQKPKGLNTQFLSTTGRCFDCHKVHSPFYCCIYNYCWTCDVKLSYIDTFCFLCGQNRGISKPKEFVKLEGEIKKCVLCLRMHSAKVECDGSKIIKKCSECGMEHPLDVTCEANRIRTPADCAKCGGKHPPAPMAGCFHYHAGKGRHRRGKNY